MSEKKEVKTQDRQGGVQARSEEERFVRPAVDIYEDSQGITLKVDLPGVSKDRLDVQIDGTNLAIDANVAITLPKDTEALYADLHTTRFRRSFTLSNELETGKIKADMKDGVLTLQLPKRAEAQPRKIEVTLS